MAFGPFMMVGKKARFSITFKTTESKRPAFKGGLAKTLIAGL
jgi:hypothetical protein